MCQILCGLMPRNREKYMIDLSKWNEYTTEQKRKKIPWIILVIVVWIIAIAYWLIGR